jgi:hypothetical protein
VAVPLAIGVDLVLQNFKGNIALALSAPVELGIADPLLDLGLDTHIPGACAAKPAAVADERLKIGKMNLSLLGANAFQVHGVYLSLSYT